MRFLLLLSLLFCVAHTPALAASPRAVERKAVKAISLFSDLKFQRAYGKANQVLRTDPDNPYALFVRGTIAYTFASEHDDEMGAYYRQAGAQDLILLASEWPEFKLTPVVVARYPELFQGGTPGELLTEPDAVCPDLAVQIADDADFAWQEGRLAQAETSWAIALKACPENPRWWLYAGDVLFSKKDYGAAIQYWEHALELAPCYWTAHRFIADAHATLGDLDGAYHHATAAVACNPDYAIGWGFVDQVQDALGRSSVGIRRVQNVPAYHQSLASIDPAGLSPLEQERLAVERTLDTLGDDLPASWQLLAEAREAGRLDEAILILRFEQPLVPEYLAFRDEHPERLAAYVREHLAVPR
ncbi:MAG: tetratricopeptide repeat protein [Deltaproteobacteria bacterium]|nr:tetratricopeptide repeat protein [Deltaproteobacteria bacterium]